MHKTNSDTIADEQHSKTRWGQEYVKAPKNNTRTALDAILKMIIGQNHDTFRIFNRTQIQRHQQKWTFITIKLIKLSTLSSFRVEVYTTYVLNLTQISQADTHTRQVPYDWFF